MSDLCKVQNLITFKQLRGDEFAGLIYFFKIFIQCFIYPLKDFKDFVCRTLHIDEFFFLKKCIIIDNLFTLNDTLAGKHSQVLILVCFYNQLSQILGKKVPLILVNYFQGNCLSMYMYFEIESLVPLNLYIISL